MKFSDVYAGPLLYCLHDCTENLLLSTQLIRSNSQCECPN